MSEGLARPSNLEKCIAEVVMGVTDLGIDFDRLLQDESGTQRVWPISRKTTPREEWTEAWLGFDFAGLVRKCRNRFGGPSLFVNGLAEV